MTDYRITPVKHWNNNWAWWATRSFDYGGDTPTFYIGTASHYNLAAGERLAVWGTAADTDNWTDFTTVTIGTPDITFVHGSAFPAGMIYAAALPMYPFSRVQRKMQEWLADDYVSDTTSSTNGIIGYATARTVPDNSGRTAPALPFYGFKLTGDRVGNKNKAILTAYNHPSETPGPYQLEGALDWLLSGTANAETLLDWFEFYVYPCINPQAVWSGWFRSSPEDATKDNNRQWAAGGLEHVDAFKAAMAADTGTAVQVGIDYHSVMTSTDIYGDVQTGDTGGNYEYFRAEMTALDADFNLSPSDIDTSLRYLWRGTYSASLAIIMEQGGELARGVAEYKTYGENSIKSLYEMLIDGRFTYGP